MITNFTASDIPDQQGKTFFITGANTGIGFEAAKAIAAKGARVLLGCRSAQKGKDAIERIQSAHPGSEVELVEIDLADLASVERAAQVVLREPKLDVLVNNAGIMFNPKTLTKDGFESQFGVNHLGHFALTGHLLPKLLETPEARIVNISSAGHKFGNGDLFWDDIHAEKAYHPRTRYYASKLANLLFTYELDRKLRAQGSTVRAVTAHPGGADTELSRHMTGLMGVAITIASPFLRLFMNTSETGAWPTELAATHPDVESGQYFGPGKWGESSGPARQVDSSDDSKDPVKASRLWDLSIELTGVSPPV
ncbi:MAG: NAD(P)-dependent dehydrogenase (short-subunit alcohol dehydrogenase family) [Myxococcota bacterium]|jgi:NAD(P)-dependent dehydrogenase (short-subunit alcohol dehydrogenase family)